jgi:translation initiation factor IF-2
MLAPKPKRIYDLAKDFKVSSQALVNMLIELGYTPKSHMSLASAEMVAAINLRLAQEKQTARKEMEQKVHQAREQQQRRQQTPPPPPPSRPAGSGGGMTVLEGSRIRAGGSPLNQLAKRLEKKKRKRDRRKKKDFRDVDQAEVQRTFKTTMANLGSAKPKKRFRDKSASGDTAETGPTNIIQANEFMSVAELSRLLGKKSVEVIAKLFELGMMATINQRLDMDTIQTVSAEFGFDAVETAEIGETAKEVENVDELSKRAPVVTVMGHVDHGKTSLLDYIRKTNVVGGEAGAITQHIGAYLVIHNRERIVFLDTPGHEAFTAMRARGAQLTDIVVLVVAADEGVMPQTVEAIDHARAANVPIIVAMSKIDKPGARLEEVRSQLSKYNLLAEEWGGQTIVVEISSKSGAGIDKLMDMILLQAEMLDLKADPLIRAQGIVVDARLEKGRGPVVTVLIQRGTCKVSDPIVTGMHMGRIRTIHSDRDVKLDTIGPSTPAQITGLDGIPQAGDSFMVVRDEQEARDISAKRGAIKREHEFRRPHAGVTLDKVYDQIQEGQIKEVRLIIKGDVDGSVEVLSDTLGKIATSEVKTNIIRRGVGPITESDVLLAAASSAIIIGFQVAPDSRAREVARREKVDIRQYKIIYEAEQDVRKALEGLLAPTVEEKFVGSAEVRDIFRTPKSGVIGGCYVREGRINRKDKVKLMRDGKIVYTGSIGSLRRFKDDAREVKDGFECGIGIENYDDIKVGDLIEAYELIEIARTLST